MTTHITADDIAAIRAEEGGLTSFIEALTSSRPVAAAPAAPRLGSAYANPGHRPGAWPAGTRPDRDTCSPDCDCSLDHTAQGHAVPPAA